MANCIDTKYLVYIPLGLGPESERVIDMTSVQFKSILLLTLNGQPATITKPGQGNKKPRPNRGKNFIETNLDLWLSCSFSY